MAAFDQRVGGCHQRPGRRNLEQRGVVTDAQQHVIARAGPAEKRSIQVEFAERHGRRRSGASASGGRLLRRAESAGGPVQHRVDELVPIGGAEALGEVYALR